MKQPLTLQFAAWAPDLQNFATQIDGNSASTDIACADCLNVFYSDGGYRCLPSPSAIGTALPVPALSAFTYYDNVGAMQQIFVGTQDGIYTIDGNTNTLVPIENSATVFVGGWSINTRLAGTTLVSPYKLSLGLGLVTVSGGAIYSGTLSAAASGTNVGYSNGGTVGGRPAYGTLSPTADLNGNTIGIIANTSPSGSAPALIVGFNTAIPAGYFKAIQFTSLGLTYPTSSATITGNAGIGPHFTQYSWPAPPGFVAGNSYPVKLLI